MAATAQQTAIINLYTALFDRAPDAAGLDFWTQALIDGASLSTITQNFLGTPEALAIYPASQSSEQFVSAFYQAVFGRTADAGGLKFWTDALNAAGGVNSDAAKALVVSQINDIVSTPLSTKPANLTDAEYAETLADRATFANKVAVGVYFAVDTKSNDLTLAKQALAGVNADAGSVDAAKQVIDTPAGGTPPTPTTPGTTFLGTAGDDVFNFTHQSVKAGDVIDGLGGNDTLNYIDKSSTGTSFPAATVKNVETINIQNLNTGGLTEERVLFYSLHDMQDAQTLSVAGVTITAKGTASVADIVSAITTGKSVGSAAYAGSLDGYTATRNEDTITFVSTTKGNVPDLKATGTGAAKTLMMYSQGMNGVEDTIDATHFTGATTFNSDQSLAPVAFTGLAAGQSVGLIGNGINSTRGLTASYADNATAATVNISGGTSGGVVALKGANLSHTTINTDDIGNMVAGVTLAAATTSLNVNAAGNVNLSSISGTKLSSLTVEGNADMVLLGTVFSKNLSSIDAADLVGGMTVTLAASTGAVIHGGAGNDVISIGADVSISGMIDGGAGVNTLSFVTGSSLASDTATFISNINVVKLGGEFLSSQTYDLSLLDDVSYQVASQGDITLTKVGAKASITVTDSPAALTLELASITSDGDIATLTLDNQSPYSVGYGVSVGSLKIEGVERLQLISQGLADTTDAFTGNYITNSADNTSLSMVSIGGSKAIRFETGSLTNSSALTIYAGEATGKLWVAGADATKQLTIVGGSAADTIESGTAGSMVQGGAGGDAILLSNVIGVDVITYLSASESTLDIIHASGAASAEMDTITGFQVDTDKIDLTALKLFADAPSLMTITLDTPEELAQAAGSNSFFTDGDEVSHAAVAVHIGEDTYLVVDANANQTFDASADLVIKLAGVNDLKISDLMFTVAV